MIMFFTPSFPDDRPEKPINNFGDLVDFLSKFPRDHTVSILGTDGMARENVFIQRTGMSTILMADGDPIEF